MKMTQDELKEEIKAVLVAIQNLEKEIEIIHNKLNQIEVWRKSHINRPENPHKWQV